MWKTTKTVCKDTTFLYVFASIVITGWLFITIYSIGYVSIIIV